VTVINRGFTGRRSPGLDLMTEDTQGFREQLGYHDYGDPGREQRHQGD
jgi:DMSO/TMAO reductase YedYZ molybdopterin-dependent catalytic subunit